MGELFRFFYTQIVLDENMIVSGVEYIKDVLFLCMTAPVGKFWMQPVKEGEPAAPKPASLEYDGETYNDVSDTIAFGLGPGVDHSRFNWNLAMSYKAYLKTGEQKAIKNREELRKAKGLPPDGIVPVATKVTDANVQTDFVGGVKHFNALVLEIHSIFAHLKTLVDDIKGLEAAAPPAAAPRAARSAPRAPAAAWAASTACSSSMMRCGVICAMSASPTSSRL